MDSAIQLLNEIVIMMTSNGLSLSRFTRLLKLLLTLVLFLKQELLEFRRLEHFIHALIKDMLMQCSLKMAGNFLRRDGTGDHIIGFQKLCFESQY